MGNDTQCFLYMMKLDKTSTSVSNVAGETFIGLGHFDEVTVKLQETNCILPSIEESNKIKKNSQIFYLYSNSLLKFDNPFYIFVFSYHRNKKSIQDDTEMIKLQTTNNADEVFFYSSTRLEDCFDKAVKINKLSDFTHTVLCFDPTKKELINKKEKITKMIVRLIVNDYSALKKFKKKAGFNSLGHKFGNYDALLFKDNIHTELAMEYFIPESKTYMYHKKWKDMTLNSTCTEFYFTTRVDGSKGEIFTGNEKLIKAGKKFCENFKNCDSRPDVLMPSINIFERDLEGIYSDYTILNFWGPLKMLYQKLEKNKKYVSNKSLYEIANAMNNIISDIFNSTLHTFQMPIPVEPSCSIHIFLILRYIAFLDFFVSKTEKICIRYISDDEEASDFHLSFLYNSIDSYIINTERCFTTIERPPNSRMVIINMPRKYITKPSVLLAISLHELTHSMDYKARNRMHRFKCIKLILIEGFCNVIIASILDMISENQMKVDKAKYIKDLCVEDIIANEMSDILLQKYKKNNSYYFKDVEQDIYNDLEEEIKKKASNIIKNIASNDLDHAGLLMEKLDETISSFLFRNERWSLVNSLEDVYYVCDECFSDLVMISTLNLTFKEYEEIMLYIDSNFYEHANRDTVRYNVIKSVYGGEINLYKQSDNSHEKHDKPIYERNLGIFSYSSIFEKIAKHVKLCKDSFEREIESSDLKVDINKLRKDYKRICLLEVESDKYHLFKEFSKDINGFRKKVYKDIISFNS